MDVPRPYLCMICGHGKRAGSFPAETADFVCELGADARVRNSWAPSLLRGCRGREHQQHRVERKYEKRKEVLYCSPWG